MRYVYVAGPYRSDPDDNTRHAIEEGTRLMKLGFYPFVPHINAYYWHEVYKVEGWMEYDLAWLAQCDVVLRIPGESEGADMEVEEAKRLGIPVVYSIQELMKKNEEDK